MPSVKITEQGGGIDCLTDAISALADDRNLATGLRRALNRTGDKAYKAVTGVVPKQMGLSRTQVEKYGAIRKLRANFRHQSFHIVSTGAEIPLKEFAARQFAYGVRARPWAKRQRFKGAFIFAGTHSSGKFVGGGHVFHRITAASKPLELMFGPSVPAEMVKDESAKAFNAAADDLPRRLAHEVRQITKGAVS